MPDTMIRFPGEVTLEAAANGAKPKRLAILAYNGGQMRVAGFGYVVLDLSGLKIPRSVPILADHESTLKSVIGAGEAKSDGRKLTAGVRLADCEAAESVVSLLQAGVPLQASVGADPIERRTVGAGGIVKVNGQEIEAGPGGLTVVSVAKLKEISILPMAADDSTSVAIAARKTEGDQMAGTLTASEAAAAERERNQEIIRLSAGFDSIRDKAIAESWPLDQVEREVLKARADRAELQALRASRPSDVSVIRSGGGRASTREMLAAAMMLYAGRSSLAEKEYGAQVAQQAHDLRCHSLVDLCAAALRLENHDIPRDRSEMIKASFSTAHFPAVIGDYSNKVALEAYRATVPAWRSFAKVGAARDFRPIKHIRLTVGGPMEKVGKDGELKHAALGEEVISTQIDTYGRVFGLTRQDVLNDDASILSDLSAALGRQADRAVRDAVATVILGNAGSFFSSGHGNYQEGAATNLSITSLEDALAAMASAVDADGRPVDIVGQVLFVPPELESTGLRIVSSERLERDPGEGDLLPSGNPLRNRLKVVSDPRLSNANYSGNSDVGWYVFASPADAPVIVSFLDGRDAPVVETADQPFDKLGIALRGFLDFGVALGDYRAAFFSKGEA